MATKYQVFHAQTTPAAASKIIYDDGILWIEGYDHQNSLVTKVLFQDVLFVRISDEGVRLRLLHELEASRALVLTDENSLLLTWLAEESLHTRDTGQARHFLVLMGEEIVDVVSISNPVINAK